MEVARHKIHRMKFNRELSVLVLIPEEGFERLPNHIVLLDGKQAIGGKSKVSCPAFAEIAIACVKDLFMLPVLEAARLYAGSHRFGGDK